MIVQPFRGLRPRPDLATKIPSYPYDVVTDAEARALTANDPYSFLHVVRPEVDLPIGIDPHDDRVYSQGAATFRSWIERGWLVRDPRPAFYLYRLTLGDRTQTGVVGLVSVEDYRRGRIKRHEHTRPAKVEDRARLARALGAHPGPVFLAYRGSADMAQLVERGVAAPPLVDFTAPDGVGHSLWLVDEPHEVQSFERRFGEIEATYVADGHHRAEAAAQVATSTDCSRADDPRRSFLAAHFPAGELRILDYNRVVRDLDGLTPEVFLSRVESAGFTLVTDPPSPRPPRRGAFGLYLAGRWHRIESQGPFPNDPVAGLDTQLLADRVLTPILGIGDPRTDPRIDFVGGARGTEELQRRVDSREFAVAFVLWPTSIDDVLNVADAGRVMPPKSTWFEPKLRSGHVVQLLDD